MLLRMNLSPFMGLISTSTIAVGENKAAVVIVHDITGLKKIKRVLDRSEQIFLGHMLDDISHQIRNPVITIGGFARRLANMNFPKMDYAHVILDECARLETMLNTLTEFIRLPRPNPRPCQLRQIISEVENVLREIIQERGCVGDIVITEGFDCNEDVLVDINAFKRAIAAVIVNACEAYDDNGYPAGKKKVEIHVGPSDLPSWTVMLKVKDWGCGIRPHVIPKVFDPFFTTKTGHIGMGLSFAMRIQKGQAGHITVQSEVGRYTNLCFYLAKDRRRMIRTMLL